MTTPMTWPGCHAQLVRFSGSSEDLGALPHDHPLRNSPLVEMRAHYRHRGTKAWREVKHTFGIARCTFNQLARCWTDHDEWKGML
jgi:hypothetical protein